jgi:hypothetical protein
MKHGSNTDKNPTAGKASHYPCSIRVSSVAKNSLGFPLVGARTAPIFASFASLASVQYGMVLGKSRGETEGNQVNN